MNTETPERRRTADDDNRYASVSLRHGRRDTNDESRPLTPEGPPPLVLPTESLGTETLLATTCTPVSHRRSAVAYPRTVPPCGPRPSERSLETSRRTVHVQNKIRSVSRNATPRGSWRVSGRSVQRPGTPKTVGRPPTRSRTCRRRQSLKERQPDPTPNPPSGVPLQRKGV